MLTSQEKLLAAQQSNPSLRTGFKCMVCEDLAVVVFVLSSFFFFFSLSIWKLVGAEICFLSDLTSENSIIASCYKK